MLSPPIQSKSRPLTLPECSDDAASGCLSLVNRSEKETLPFLIFMVGQKQKGAQSRRAQLLPAARFASSELQYKELVVSKEQNYSLGSGLHS